MHDLGVPAEVLGADQFHVGGMVEPDSEVAVREGGHGGVDPQAPLRPWHAIVEFVTLDATGSDIGLLRVEGLIPEFW